MGTEMHDEGLRELEEQFRRSDERLYHLNAIIGHAEALEEMADEDDLAYQQIVKETRLKAEQLKGSCQ